MKIMLFSVTISTDNPFYKLTGNIELPFTVIYE